MRKGNLEGQQSVEIWCWKVDFLGGMSEKHEKGEPRRIHIQKSKPVEIIFNGLWVRMVYFYFLFGWITNHIYIFIQSYYNRKSCQIDQFLHFFNIIIYYILISMLQCYPALYNHELLPAGSGNVEIPTFHFLTLWKSADIWLFYCRIPAFYSIFAGFLSYFHKALFPMFSNPWYIRLHK